MVKPEIFDITREKKYKNNCKLCLSESVIMQRGFAVRGRFRVRVSNILFGQRVCVCVCV